MRVAFVLNALRTGGAEIHTVTLAQELRERGHDTLLLPLVHLDQVEPRGVPVADVRGNSPTDIAAMKRLAANLRDFQAEFIFTVNERPTIYAHAAQFFGAPRVPIAAIYHTTVLQTTAQRINNLIARPFIRRSEALIFVSDGQQAYCLGRGMTARHVETIHNGIDGKRFSAAVAAAHRSAKRAELDFASDDFVIGLSAAFRREKNHVQAVEAVSTLRGKGVSARLLLVGEGPFQGVVRDRAAALGLSDHVFFAGRQSDVVPWLSACDVGVLTSVAVETFSLAALEFMGLGVPCVLSELGGASEMIEPGDNGYLFPVGDTPALVAKLEKLTDPVHRREAGQAAEARVHSLFTVDTMVDRYDALLSKIRAV